MPIKRICYIGASTTEGLGDEANLGWAGRLVDGHTSPLINYNLGVRGQTLAQIQARAKPECSARLPNPKEGCIIFSPGTNDLALLEDGSARSPIEGTLSIFEKIITDLKDITFLAVIGPCPVDESKMPFYSAASSLNLNFRNDNILQADLQYKNICDKHSVLYISVHHAMMQSPVYVDELHNNDGLHPNGAGYQEQADFLLNSSALTMFLDQ